jgi:choline dehydrogenase-like flavoprotein
MRADVIIIGSGPAAVSAAWPLVDSGCSVTMLDAAERPAPDPPLGDIASFRTAGEGWRHAFGEHLAGLRLSTDRSPKFATRIGQAVVAFDSGLPAIRAVNFLPVRSFSAGGLSKVWGAFATTFDDNDLQDYPLRGEDLAQSYQTIACRIGLSGRKDDLAAFHGDGLPLQPPMWLSPIAGQVVERYERRKRRNGFAMGLARNAVATQPTEGRQACNRCGLCLYGCGRLAIYDSTQDLARLCSAPNFRYRSASRVIRILSVGEQEKVVEIDMCGHRQVASAKALVLAAGTLNSTALVLSSNGTIGRRLRLLTNPVGALAFLVPSWLGTPLPRSGFSLGQLSYRLDIEESPDFATGVFYTADTLPVSYVAENLPLSRRAALRLSRWMSTALLVATCYLPGRFSRNFVSLELGTDRGEELHISGETPSETRGLLRTAAKRLSREMRRYGMLAIPGSLTIPLPGADGHLAGTLPMARHGPALTCTPDCEVRPWRDIFVVDGSCLSSLPAKHCTLTIMANADRVGRVLANRLVSVPKTGILC